MIRLPIEFSVDVALVFIKLTFENFIDVWFLDSVGLVS
jgi:hypothetical protein